MTAPARQHRPYAKRYEFIPGVRRLAWWAECPCGWRKKAADRYRAEALADAHAQGRAR